MQMLDEIIASHKDREGPLLPLLHDAQAAFGFISEDMVRTIAHALNLTRAEVHGVVSFYHDFKTRPETRPVIKLCGAEACKSRGAEALVADAKREAGTAVKIEPVYCLGLCSVGPAAMIGSGVFARLDRQMLAELIEALT